MNTPSSQKDAPLLQQFCMWARIFIHVVRGAFTFSFVFPLIDPEAKKVQINKWSSQLLRIVNIELQVRGHGVIARPPYLLVANHISWLDIHAINAYEPIRFVAKSEVMSWPVFGWMARQLGTVFVCRDRARHTKTVVDQLAAILQGESICLFPEGTTTVGARVLPFQPNLFESALLAGVPVQPLAICYVSSITNERTEVPAFVGGMGLLESIANIVKKPYLRVELQFLPCFSGAFDAEVGRKKLALYCQECIARCL